MPRSEPIGTFEGIGPLGLEGKTPADAPEIFAMIITNVVGFMTVIGGLWFLFQVLIAGFNWLGAGGDKQKLAEAQAKLTSGVVGFGVVALGIVLVRLVAALLKVDLILDPVKAIPMLTPQ